VRRVRTRRARRGEGARKRLQRAVDLLEHDLELERGLGGEARSRVSELERALTAQRAATQLLHDELELREHGGVIRPAVAGATPPPIDRFARRRR
jgi:hypothetical protein